MIAIVDYGVGNLFSLVSGVKSMGAQVCVTGKPEELRAADRILLPGVGAFADAAAKLIDSVEGDEKTGVRIVLKALEEPVRQIAANGGLEGSVIIDTIRRSGKAGYGFDAYKEEYCDMVPAGIVDPTKVTRSALQNAASIAAMVLTTESLVADKKEPTPPAPPMGDPTGGMGGMY